ncbi:RidA family protein [Sphingomonas sp. C8-2]|uniref:Enamine deaminase RidA, house cleaning of reactive enamine intermediates, YjgF/YER057c/UK114 family n=1 Tax=Rhizorhabdus histidinilytica TaxID=439228 RepID=A0A1T5GA02_9SPHN|nr:RidA family protein [Rhizorhabdus histidinilytica]QEH77131.1 RidA family protein [Sphingomonas sp. C8-2]SKC05244.1 Enamine deaminase RidA, house cleaning of reactive enamine intermediates, YjgF/YER057c/UK114 family [Rhizorhabdus histidinilytica]
MTIGRDRRVRRIDPPTLAPPVMDLYAQIVVASAGRLAFVAGQVALDPEGRLVDAGDHRAQARQCFANIRAAVAAVGATPADIVRMTINVVDYRAELIGPIFESGREIFGDEWPITASMLLGVAALGLPEWLIEIDAVVALPDEV